MVDYYCQRSLEHHCPVSPSVCPSVCPVCPSVCPVSPSVCPVSPSVCPSVYPVSPSVCPVSPSVCPVSPSVCPVSPSVRPVSTFCPSDLLSIRPSPSLSGAVRSVRGGAVQHGGRCGDRSVLSAMSAVSVRKRSVASRSHSRMCVQKQIDLT